jgi:phospholipid/cholesterol/gamma-HCH transport system substrate-binding protein
VPNSKRKLAIVILGGCILVAVPVLLVLRAGDFSPGYVQLHTFMDDAAGLMDGTQVRLNGIPIGYLDGQKHTNSRDLRRKIQFDLKVRERYLRDIPADSVVGLASDNLLGQQYIGVRQGRSALHIEAGAELGTTQTTDITMVMAQMSRQLDRLQDVFTRASTLFSAVSKGSGAIGKIAQDQQLQTGAGVSDEFDRLMADVRHGHGTVTKLFYEDPIDKQLEAPRKRLDDILANAEIPSASLKEIQGGIERAQAEFRTVQKEIDAGKGSLARLAELQGRFDELTGRVYRMMDKLNSGQGTLGQSTVNPQLDAALAGMTREVQDLSKALKTNPLKMVRFHLF